MMVVASTKEKRFLFGSTSCHLATSLNPSSFNVFSTISCTFHWWWWPWDPSQTHESWIWPFLEVGGGRHLHQGSPDGLYLYSPTQKSEHRLMQLGGNEKLSFYLYTFSRAQDFTGSHKFFLYFSFSVTLLIIRSIIFFLSTIILGCSLLSFWSLNYIRSRSWSWCSVLSRIVEIPSIRIMQTMSDQSIGRKDWPEELVPK